ncbi:MAG: phosphoribosylpyrophosphate synthetase [Bacteroidia bacterium]
MERNLNQYDTLSEAITALQKKGFTQNLEPQDEVIADQDTGKEYLADHLTIIEYHRFEGASNPDDMSVVYAVKSSDGMQGLIVDAYGAYASRALTDLVKKLNMKKGIS